MPNMEHNLIVVCLCFLITFGDKRVSAHEACTEGINDAFQRLENPRYVFLVSGSNLWEFDRHEDKIVQEAIPLQTYFKEAPASPDAALATHYKFRIIFEKNYKRYYFNCSKSSENCRHFRTLNFDDVFKARRVHFSFEAGFYYLNGMPKPRDHFGQPYYTHYFIKEDIGLDCRSVTNTWNNNRTFESLCDIADVDKKWFPNYFKLNPNRQQVVASEVFFTAKTNETDFLIVINRAMKYTVNGTIKIRDLDELFKCASNMIIYISIAIIFAFQVVAVMVFLGLVFYFKAKSSSDEEASTTTINEATTRRK